MKSEEIAREFQRRKKTLKWVDTGTRFLLAMIWVYFVRRGFTGNFLRIFRSEIFGSEREAFIVLVVLAGVGMALSSFGACFLIRWLVCLFLMKCPSCGKYVAQDNSRFCPHCGIGLQAQTTSSADG